MTGPLASAIPWAVGGGQEWGWTPSHHSCCHSQDPSGELQGQNVLTVRYSLELTAARFGLDVEAVQTLLSAGLEKLFQARKHRPKPHLDSKMLAAWNGGAPGPGLILWVDAPFPMPLLQHPWPWLPSLVDVLPSTSK